LTEKSKRLAGALELMQIEILFVVGFLLAWPILIWMMMLTVNVYGFEMSAFLRFKRLLFFNI